MTTGDEPQLGGQHSDNAPMISGRGTKIIVSARGAYEARNLPALFDAMSPDQQVLFRQAAVRAMLAHIRPELEQAAESHPAIYDTLRSLDAWLASSAPIAEGVYTNPTDTRFGDVSPIEGRLRGLELAAIFTQHNAIGYATDALLYVPDDDVPQQPHSLILQSELEDWIFEAGWAIMQGRNAPPLILNAARIEALIADVERWYRKGKLPILVHLMAPDQQEAFKRARRHLVMYYVNQIPADLWHTEHVPVLAHLRHWLIDPAAVTVQAIYEAKQPYLTRPRNRQFIEAEMQEASTAGIHVWSVLMTAVAAFENDLDIDNLNVPYADATWNVVDQVMRYLNGVPIRASWQHHDAAEAWQLDTAYAILTDHPIPPLGDPDAR